MGANRICQAGALLCWLLGAALIFGPLDDPNDPTGTRVASLFLALLGLLALVVGAFAALNERVIRLERMWLEQKKAQGEEAAASEQSPQ